MYKLLRRISSSFKERFDRKQGGGGEEEEDNSAETSRTTPQTGSKRRMSEDDDVPNGSLSKRSRGHASVRDENDDYDDESRQESGVATPAQEGGSQASSTAGSPKKETEGVRQVTKGVKEVELEDRKEKGKGKEVVRGQAIEEEEEGDLVDESDAKDEETPEDATKSGEAPSCEVKNVADADTATVDGKESSNIDPELSKDATPLEATTHADTPEDREIISPQVQSNTSTVDEALPESSSIPTTIPPVDASTDVPIHTPNVVAEPLFQLSSDEAQVKVQS